jgi:hypothetical protein
MKRGPWSPEDLETLQAMAAAGISKTLIALRLKRTLQGVKSIARERGIRLTQQRSVSNKPAQHIAGRVR